MAVTPLNPNQGVSGNIVGNFNPPSGSLDPNLHLPDLPSVPNNPTVPSVSNGKSSPNKVSLSTILAVLQAGGSIASLFKGSSPEEKLATSTYNKQRSSDFAQQLYDLYTSDLYKNSGSNDFYKWIHDNWKSIRGRFGIKEWNSFIQMWTGLGLAGDFKRQKDSLGFEKRRPQHIDGDTYENYFNSLSDFYKWYYSNHLGSMSENEFNTFMTQYANDYNSKEAEKARLWQEEYYKKYASPQALVQAYREAGYNPFLQSQTVGQAASGASASAVTPNMYGSKADELAQRQQEISMQKGLMLRDTIDDIVNSSVSLQDAFQRMDLRGQEITISKLQQNQIEELIHNLHTEGQKMDFDYHLFTTYGETNEKLRQNLMMYNVDLAKCESFLKGNDLRVAYYNWDRGVQELDARIKELSIDLSTADIAGKKIVNQANALYLGTRMLSEIAVNYATVGQLTASARFLNVQSDELPSLWKAQAENYISGSYLNYANADRVFKETDYNMSTNWSDWGIKNWKRTEDIAYKNAVELNKDLIYKNSTWYRLTQGAKDWSETLRNVTQSRLNWQMGNLSQSQAQGQDMSNLGTFTKYALNAAMFLPQLRAFGLAGKVAGLLPKP